VQILGLFMIVLGLAVGALCIDMGDVRLARRQMQTAVDGAATEVLRADSDDPNGAQVARINARRIVRAGFDDNFDDIEGTIRLGAGGDIDYQGGSQIAGDFRASATIQGASPYRPDLALNEAGDPSGDIVAGTYNALATDHREGSSGDPYARADFTPGAGTAALVRMRRTSEPLGNPEVAAAGPPVPGLWSRGRLSAGSPELWSRIERGTHVRAAAIADGRPAMSAGIRSESMPHGLIPVSVTLEEWLAGNLGNRQPITPRALTIGEAVAPSPGGSIDDAIAAAGARLVAIVADIPGSSGGTAVPRVVGFGEVTTAGGAWARRDPQRIIPQNTSATFVRTEHLSATATDAFDFGQVTPILQQLYPSDPALPRLAALAPARVRATD
jgi:hypothetical protein